MVIVALPGGQQLSGVPKRGEHCLVQALVPQPHDETLGKGIPGGLPGAI